MAMVAAGIANNGKVMKPYLVDEVQSPDLDVLEKTDPERALQHAISPATARKLTEMMVASSTRAPRSPAQIPGIQVAGKTGTAQSAPSRPPYAWFVSFAPADNPKVAVAVLVQDAGVERDAISGSGLAAPIAKSVMEAVITVTPPTRRRGRRYRDEGADRHRRHGRGLARRATPCSAGRSRSSCSSVSTPTTRASGTASRTRPGTPPPCTTPTSPPVFDFGESDAEDGGRPYLVMELVDGRPLSELIRPGQPMDPDQARDLIRQAAEALAQAHAAGIVHRDVKPANLLVTPAGQVKVTDFGIARAADSVALTGTGQVLGTPHYLSPEQAEGKVGDPGQRRLRPRRGALRVPHRTPPVRRRHPGGDRARASPRHRCPTCPPTSPTTWPR